jgi:hypothetical protein
MFHLQSLYSDVTTGIEEDRAVPFNDERASTTTRSVAGMRRGVKGISISPHVVGAPGWVTLIIPYPGAVCPKA